MTKLLITNKGKVVSVKIYKSKFGEEMMKIEEEQGPVGIMKKDINTQEKITEL